MSYDPNSGQSQLQPSYGIGETATIQIATYYESGSSAGSTASLQVGTGMVGIDPERETIGTCSSNGTAGGIIDTTRTEADGTWRGVKLTHINGTNGKHYTTRVTNSSSSETTLVLQGLPTAPQAGDNYILHGYPLATWQAASISGHVASVTFTGSNLMQYAGPREVHMLADLGTDEAWHEFRIDVE